MRRRYSAVCGDRASRAGPAARLSLSCRFPSSPPPVLVRRRSAPMTSARSLGVRWWPDWLEVSRVADSLGCGEDTSCIRRLSRFPGLLLLCPGFLVFDTPRLGSGLNPPFGRHWSRSYWSAAVSLPMRSRGVGGWLWWAHTGSWCSCGRLVRGGLPRGSVARLEHSEGAVTGADAAGVGIGAAGGFTTTSGSFRTRRTGPGAHRHSPHRARARRRPCSRSRWRGGSQSWEPIGNAVVSVFTNPQVFVVRPVRG